MNREKEVSRNIIHERIKDSLKTTRRRQQRLKRVNTRLLVVSFVFSAGTSVSAFTALYGDPGNWETLCLLAGIISAVSGVFTFVHQQLNIPNKMARVNEYLGRLNALEIGMSLNTRNDREVGLEYEQIVSQFGEFSI